MQVLIELLEERELVDKQDVYLSEADAALVRLACHVDGRRPAIVLHHALSMGLLAWLKEYGAAHLRAHLQATRNAAKQKGGDD